MKRIYRRSLPRRKTTTGNTKDVPEILITEVKCTLAKLNRIKSVGPGGIVIDMLIAFDHFSIEKIKK